MAHTPRAPLPCTTLRPPSSSRWCDFPNSVSIASCFLVLDGQAPSIQEHLGDSLPFQKCNLPSALRGLPPLVRKPCLVGLINPLGVSLAQSDGVCHARAWLDSYILPSYDDRLHKPRAAIAPYRPCLRRNSAPRSQQRRHSATELRFPGADFRSAAFTFCYAACGHPAPCSRQVL
jgi:hypothetical protein